MLNMILPWWVRPLIILAVAASLYGLGRLHQAQADERERDKQTITSMQDGDTHVANYVRKIGELHDVSTTADELRGLCNKPRSVHSTFNVAPAVGANPVDRPDDPLHDLAGELHSTERNKYKCEELQAVVLRQTKPPKAWYDPRGWFSTSPTDP